MTRKDKKRRLAGLKLERLSKQLRMRGIPSQITIARAVGLDQPVVSRARNGELKRLTPRIDELARYVNMRVRDMRRAGLLEATSRSGPASASTDARSEALQSCREYLLLGCDPDVLIDQVAILRRAQASRSAGMTTGS